MQLTVADLRTRVANGEERTFSRTAACNNEEPDFYRIATRGEYLNVMPQWLNPPPQDDRPRPKTRFIANRHAPLATMDAPHFRFSGSRELFSDFFHVDVFYYLLSSRLAQLITDRDPNGVEARDATVEFEANHRETFQLVMPVRVLDAVDTEKTDVTIHSRESPAGSGRFRIDVWYNSGYALRSDVVRDAQTFVEEFRCHWLWRADLVHAAAARGATGLLAKHASATRPEIRF